MVLVPVTVMVGRDRATRYDILAAISLLTARMLYHTILSLIRSLRLTVVVSRW